MKWQITLQVKTENRTPLGDVTESWATLATVWAKRVPLTAGENFDGQTMQTVDVETVRYEIRWRSDIGQNTQLRVLEGSRIYDITGIAEMGFKQGLALTAKATAQP